MTDFDRRGFLGVLGASFAALSLGECRFGRPREPIIPYRVEPEDVTPGVANWYASTCRGCEAACGLLVKCREGRPIKLEGNPDHPLSLGGLCARGQATVLDLYDSARLRGPLASGAPSTWTAVDEAILAGLDEARRRNAPIRLLSRTVHSPSMLAAIEAFRAAYPSARLVQADPLPASAILDAHALTHGEPMLPWYRFDRANVIVSFDADFLGTWISPVEFARAWAKGRAMVPKRMSWHAQIEARLSPTGANADRRLALAPSRQLAAVCDLARRVGAEDVPDAGDPGIDLSEVAAKLVEARGRSLIVSGSRDVNVQIAVNAANHSLENYGTTLDLERPSLQLQGGSLDEIVDGDVAALIVLDANPAYDHPRAADFAAAMARIPLTVSLSGRRDETADRARFVCPDHHPFESWGDAHPHVGVHSLIQPVIAPMGDTRAAIESLLAWAGRPESAYEFVRRRWKERVPSWEQAVHDGAVAFESEKRSPPGYRLRAPIRVAAPAGEGFEIDAHAGVALGDGRQANNPWLQELPDPITKVAWGNTAAVSPASAQALGVVEGRVVEISGRGHSARLPIVIVPGMADGVVAAALGYGRTHAGPIAANYPVEKMLPVEREEAGGANVYPLIGAAFVRVVPTAAMDAPAKHQTYDSETVPFTGKDRDPARSVSLAELQGDRRAEPVPPPSLWPAHEYPGSKWGMAVDLNACIGCSACAIGCQAENNIPVVGRAEVRKNRNLHWIRIDRYFADGDTMFQPMLCQHCDNAPCETVCPVLATVHGSEGLNMQVYNRCVGTRYCANNCPYKVRRFNWFDYAHEDATQNLALNPDVTVRSRGVMEKCSMCVQRINEGRAAAKREGRRPRDGEIAPACAQSCPTQAVVFGDLNDPSSRVARMAADPRAYRVLEELGTRPAVTYLARVRNR